MIPGLRGNATSQKALAQLKYSKTKPTSLAVYLQYGHLAVDSSPQEKEIDKTRSIIVSVIYFVLDGEFPGRQSQGSESGTTPKVEYGDNRGVETRHQNPVWDLAFAKVEEATNG